MRSFLASFLLAAFGLGLPLFADHSTSTDHAVPTRTYLLDEVDRVPVAQKQTPPTYPAARRASKVSGEARIQFVVDTDGATTQVQCLSSTAPEFAESALAAVRQWRFTPAQKDGQPVACRLEVPIVFSLSH